MTTKIDFNLTGVPRTLIFPLIGRAIVSRDKNSVLKDDRAIQLMESLNIDFSHFPQPVDSSSLSWAGDRALFFDNAVNDYLAKHPKATIVNIGAGLETAFYRVDNGQLTWVDLDVPEVIALRQTLLPPPKRVHYIPKSVFDYSWIADVKQFGEDIFLFAGGVFIYFPVEKMKPLFIEMANQFEKTELIFDSIPKQDLAKANELLKKLEITDAKLQWGFEEDQFQTWSPNIHLISHTFFSHQAKNKNDEDVLLNTYMTKVSFSPSN